MIELKQSPASVLFSCSKFCSFLTKCFLEYTEYIGGSNKSPKFSVFSEPGKSAFSCFLAAQGDDLDVV